ncbi:MAG TPA: hypothetical protein VGH04_00795, partial [Gemmatimonadaceae bacterium]
ITAIAPDWILAYDSTLAHRDPKSLDHSGIPSGPGFRVTVSPAGEKANVEVLVGFYNYVDTTLNCYTDCSGLQRVRSKSPHGSSRDRAP